MRCDEGLSERSLITKKMRVSECGGPGMQRRKRGCSGMGGNQVEELYMRRHSGVSIAHGCGAATAATAAGVGSASVDLMESASMR